MYSQQSLDNNLYKQLLIRLNLKPLILLWFSENTKNRLLMTPVVNT